MVHGASHGGSPKPSGRPARALRGLFVLALAGCFDRTGLPDGAGGVLIDPDGTLGDAHCESDAACDRGELCARTGTCLPAAQVHAVHVTWTLRGQPANTTTCSAAPDLAIAFYTDREATLRYAPVVCSQGKFTVDKLPTSFSRVTLGATRGDAEDQTAPIDPVTGDAMIDLPL